MTVISNFHGDKRYVLSGPDYVLLFMNAAAAAADNPNPAAAFYANSPARASCGPDAAFSLLRWYGIDRLFAEDGAAESTFPGGLHERLVRDMKTNRWGPFGLLHGTSIGHFWKITRRHLQAFLPPGYAVRQKTGLAEDVRYASIDALLRQGHPVAVAYKTSAFGGHFTLIVGLDGRGVAADDTDAHRIVLARPSGRADVATWGAFRKLWKRRYAGIVQLGRYPRLYVREPPASSR